MRPAPFDYLAPHDIDEALAAFEPGTSVALLAGGQSLLPALTRRQMRPDLVVDLNGIQSLQTYSVSDRTLELGALTRHRWLELEELVRRRVPVIAAAAATIGDPGVRRRGTLGGSLSHAQPGAQLPVVAVLLDARLHVASAGDRRAVAAGQFFLGPFRTGMRAGEILVSVELPWTAPDEVCAVHRFSAQRHGRNLTAAARVRRDESGRCTDARVVVGLGHPVSLDSVAAQIVDRRDLSASLVRSAASGAAAAVAEQDDTVRPDDHPLIAAAVAEVLRSSCQARPSIAGD
jgi:aerobic carbon-monoxide dehydrogenase medium subunit